MGQREEERPFSHLATLSLEQILASVAVTEAQAVALTTLKVPTEEFCAKKAIPNTSVNNESAHRSLETVRGPPKPERSEISSRMNSLT